LEKKDNLIVKAFKNKKIRSVIFLTLWIIFIVFLFVKYAIPYEKIKANQTNNTAGNEVLENEDDIVIPFNDMKKSLLKYNFNYTYTVNDENGKVIYKGTMFGNETLGYKESQSGIEKYYVKGTEIYKEVLGDRVLVTDKSLNVYNNYLSVDYIMDMLTDAEYTYQDNQYGFQINDVYVKIVLGVDNIKKIEITDQNNNYLLEFSNVNEITELTY